jgi:MYXO-CTERM domain-containing protein
MPLVESVDVDFANPQGKLFDRTRFDFTVSRAHNFSAGEYSVTVKRADGVQIGTTQTVRFSGDNPVIDRRAISFVGSSGKKDKDKAAAPAAAAEGAAAAADKPAAAAEGEAPTPAADTTGAAADKPAEPGNDPAAQEKVPPSSKGCGCRVGGPSGISWLGSAAVVFGLAFLRLRRRRTPVCPSPLMSEGKGQPG